MTRGSRSARTTSGILAAIAGLATVGLLPWLGKPAFPDERASLHAARLGWTLLWQHSRVVDLVLLPYYSLLHLWTELSGSIEWARFLSLLAFGLTVFLVGHLGARLGGRVCGVLAATVAATNPLLVTAALSARPYALSALAATAAVAALLRWLEGGGTRWAWLFCAASIATLCLHLFAVLAPLSVLVAAIALKPRMFRGRWRTPDRAARARHWPRPWSSRSSERASGARSPGSRPRSTARSSCAPWKDRRAEGTPRTVVVVLATAIASAATCLWARRGGSRRTRLDLRLLGILLAWAALPTATLVAGSLVRPLFLDRYVTASVPGLAIAIALLAACAVHSVAVRSAARWRDVVAGVVLAGAAVILFAAFSIPAARLTYLEAISAQPPVRRATTMCMKTPSSRIEAELAAPRQVARRADGDAVLTRPRMRTPAAGERCADDRSFAAVPARRGPPSVHPQ